MNLAIGSGMSLPFIPGVEPEMCPPFKTNPATIHHP